MNYKNDIPKIARDILEGNINLIEGARKMVRYQLEDNLRNNDDMIFFVLVESESDHLPVGDVRKRWSKESLIEKDKEIEEFIASYWEDAVETCKSLIKLFDKVEDY